MKQLKHPLTKIFLLLLFVASLQLSAQESLKVFVSAPTVMVSNVTGGTLETETFEDFVALPNFSWAPLPAGYASNLGTYLQTEGQSYVKNDDQYGAGTGKYMSIRNGARVNLELFSSVQYFGFAWPAGDGQNTIRIKRNGQVIGEFMTVNVVSLLPKNASNFITAIDGSSYSTFDYYGKPGTGQNNNEPYAYLHFVATPGLAFDEIEFAMGVGGEFENDNHSILSDGAPILQGDWVELIALFPPTAHDDSGSGLPGNAVTISVLDNDIEGTGTILPATVQIDGTATAGDPLVVVGEGVWTVNTTNGEITFTPELGFTGNPTPIKYFVRDNNGLASNLATVTVTYLVGPTAVNDFETTTVDLPVVIDVLENDIPGDGLLLPPTVAFVIGTEPDAITQGIFTVNPADGMVTFSPATGFTGVVTIGYEVCDDNGLCNNALITVEVIANIQNFFPAGGFGTLAFEDLWPALGDYDFNDLVIDYQFMIESNMDNFVDQLTATFTIQAFGASFENGFGFQLANPIDPAHLNVTGYSLTESYIGLNPNGTEAGQNLPTIIVFDNAFNEMQHPGMGIGVNTEQWAPYVSPETIVIEIVFEPNEVHFNDLDISNFNPFLIVNQNRAVEVHLAAYPPTDLADQSMFGMLDDATDPGTSTYYVTENNLPWAINLYEKFDWPVEKQDIIMVHLKFAEWAVSGGVLFPNWYQNISGYRNNGLIYTVP
jgi:LruC domain-containing protein